MAQRGRNLMVAQGKNAPDSSKQYCGIKNEAAKNRPEKLENN